MKVLILLGGSGAPEALLRQELASSDLVICADSGAAHLNALGRLPDVLVGDMDSIDSSLLEAMDCSGVELVRALAAKDETDGWLALDQAIARGATEIVILGAMGGRADHLLGNLMLLVRAAKRGIRAFIRDGECEIMAVTGPVEITGKAGQIVSILPIGEGVSVCYLDGLQYGTKEPLPLPIDAPNGVSNVMTADVAHVVVEGWGYLMRYEGEL